MKTKLSPSIASLAIVPLLFAGHAMATPGKSGVCSSCHDRDSSVTVQATFEGCNGSNANYTVSVSNTYSGQEGWAVFDSGSNIQNAYGRIRSSNPVFASASVR